MGLLSIFKKKELSPEEVSYVKDLETFHDKFKTRYQFEDGWHAINLAKNDIILSFGSTANIKDLALSLSPRAPGLVQKGQPADVLVDLSLNSEKTPEECLKVVAELSRPLTFFKTTFEPKQIVSKDETLLPRIGAHGAGVTGFWLWLPLPQNAFKDVEAFGEVSSWCIEVAKKLAG